MTALMGKSWNYFTAVAVGGRVHLYPGSGNFDWETVREYIAAKTWDNSTRMDAPSRKALAATWDDRETNGLRGSVFHRDDNVQWMIVAFEYEDSSDPKAEALTAYEHLNVDMIEGLGADVLTPVQVASKDIELMGEETLGRIEMRVGFLLDEACALRMSPPMYPAEDLTLLEQYNAVKSTWEIVSDIAISSLVNEDVRTEARYLTYSICLLRPDLYPLSRAKGVEPAGDPAIKWHSRTGSNRNW